MLVGLVCDHARRRRLYRSRAMDTLTVIEKVRPGAPPDGFLTNRHVGHWALTVNGVSLEERVAFATGHRHD